MNIGKINNVCEKLLNVRVKKVDPTRPSTYLAKEVFKNKCIRALEIGVYSGKNAKNIISQLNCDELVCIDPYTPYGEMGNFKQVEKIAHKLLDSQRKTKISWIKEYSNDAIKEIKESFDFIYIDGNHNYEFVKEDIKNYYALLKKGGIMGGHDVDSHDVLRAFIEFVTERKIKKYFVKDKDWFFIK